MNLDKEKEVTLGGQFTKMFIITGIVALIALGLVSFQRYLDNNDRMLTTVNAENFTTIIPKILLKEVNTSQYYIPGEFQDPFADLNYGEGIIDITPNGGDWDTRTIFLNVETPTTIYSYQCDFALKQGKLARLDATAIGEQNTVVQPTEDMNVYDSPFDTAPVQDTTNAEPVMDTGILADTTAEQTNDEVSAVINPEATVNTEISTGAVPAQNTTDATAVQNTEDSETNVDASTPNERAANVDASAQNGSDINQTKTPANTTEQKETDSQLLKQVEHLPFMDSLHH